MTIEEIDRFLRLLTEFEAPHVFNPWSDHDELDAGELGPLDRRLRLLRHMDAEHPLMILMGEAPGYQGCHFSGVPFTNEALILAGRIPRVEAAGRFTSRHRAWSEPSATIVWGALHELGIADRVVLWNAFAWHPHKPGELMSNRAPTKAELKAGAPVLRCFLSLYPGVPVVPVGRIAEGALQALHIDYEMALRHPSMGGASEFRAGLWRTVDWFLKRNNTRAVADAISKLSSESSSIH